MDERVISASLNEEERRYEATLRPSTLTEYIGQEKIKASLHVFIEAARRRMEPLDHVLFYGPPGLGKTTLAYIIAKELGVGIRATSGPAIERQGDLAAILTNLQNGEILFIDEIHRLNPAVEEILYPAMEDFKIDLIIGKGPAARTIKLDIPRFTLIGATTRTGLLTSPLRDRFGIVIRLDYYTHGELKEILKRSARILNIPLEDNGAEELARRSRGTPRIANRLLKRVRDYAEVMADGTITREVAIKALTMLEIDEHGLDIMDRKLLSTIIHKFNGGPVGIETICAAISEDRDTIEDVYEPFLIQQGFLHRTPRGRLATSIAYEHLGVERKGDKDLQEKLW